MRVTSFDWGALRGAFGDAGEVPRRLAAAESTADPRTSLETVESCVPFVCDGGTLNEGAPVFVRAVLDAADRLRLAGRPSWPFLRGALRVVSARAVMCDHFGLAPVNRIAPAADPRSLPDRLTYQGRQTNLTRAIDEIVRSFVPTLVASLREGGAEERAAAIVLAAIAGVEGRSVVSAVRECLVTETNDLVRSSLLLGLTRVAGVEDRGLVRDIIAGDLADEGVRGQGAAVAALWRLGDFAGQEPLVVERVRAALRHIDARPLLERFDYGWHDELAPGEAARAVFGGALPPDSKQALLAEAVATAERLDHDDGLPATNPAAPAAWFLLRFALARHYQRTTVLGPEDLSPEERDVLALLEQHPTWIFEAGALVPQFGILAPFGDVAPSLLRPRAHDLFALKAGVWEQRWVEWSRWKWLRAAVDQTQRKSEARAAATEIASRAVLDGCDLTTALGIVTAAAVERGLPLEGMLSLILDRADGGARPAPGTPFEATLPGERRPDPLGEGPASPSRRARFVRLALETAFGPLPDVEILRKALRDVQASETLRDRLLRQCARADPAPGEGH